MTAPASPRRGYTVHMLTPADCRMALTGSWASRHRPGWYWYALPASGETEHGPFPSRTAAEHAAKEATR